MKNDTPQSPPTLSPTSQAILETMTAYHAERLAHFERGQQFRAR